MFRKILLVVFMFAFAGQIFAHCGSCGVGSAKDGRKKTACTRKAEKKAKLVKAFNLSEADEKKLNELDAQMKENMKAVKDQYRSDVSGILNEAQQDLYFMGAKKKKKGCCKKGKR
eukprot:COSAG01_NODE_61_length_29729_cov_196.711779_14_plen_115_part_00